MAQVSFPYQGFARFRRNFARCLWQQNGFTIFLVLGLVCQLARRGKFEDFRNLTLGKQSQNSRSEKRGPQTTDNTGNTGPDKQTLLIHHRHQQISSSPILVARFRVQSSCDSALEGRCIICQSTLQASLRLSTTLLKHKCQFKIRAIAF